MKKINIALLVLFAVLVGALLKHYLDFVTMGYVILGSFVLFVVVDTNKDHLKNFFKNRQERKMEKYRQVGSFPEKPTKVKPPKKEKKKKEKPAAKVENPVVVEEEPAVSTIEEKLPEYTPDPGNDLPFRDDKTQFTKRIDEMSDLEQSELSDGELERLYDYEESLVEETEFEPPELTEDEKKEADRIAKSHFKS